MTTGTQFWQHAELAMGVRYVFGAEAQTLTPLPRALDCSELVEVTARDLGVRPTVPDGSNNQRLFCHPISVDQAINTAGALLFIGGNATHHVAISKGNGWTIEARGRKWPVGNFTAHGRFDHAGLIPGVDYSGRAPLPAPPPFAVTPLRPAPPPVPVPPPAPPATQGDDDDMMILVRLTDEVAPFKPGAIFRITNETWCHLETQEAVNAEVSLAKLTGGNPGIASISGADLVAYTGDRIDIRALNVAAHHP